MDALVLDGRYRIGERLGEGGMGAVWEAMDLRLERQVAVKVMSGVSVRRDPRAKDRFDREAKLLAGLASPYVVTVHDAGEAEVEGNKLLYLVMERLHGRSLSEVIEQELPTLDEVARWAEQICRALAVAHEAGVVHRDLKPANVMVCADGLVRVLDFGIAAVLTEAPDQARLTSTGLVVGTPAYMAPEQIESGTYDARSDLYALGCMLYELVVGRPPFVGDALYALMRQHMTAVPELPSTRRPGVPAAWDALIMHLLAKEPDDRPGAAGDVAVGLRQLPRPEVSEPAGFVPRAAEEEAPPGYVPTRIDPRMAMLAPSPIASPAASPGASPAAPPAPAVPPMPAAPAMAPRLPDVPPVPDTPPPPEAPPWLTGGQRSGPFEGVERLAVELRWRLAPDADGEGDPEVDGSALAVDAEGRVLSDLHFVFYNNPALPSDHDEQGNAIELAGHEEAAEGVHPVEHRFLVEPGRLDAGTDRIVFALSLHEAEERGQNLTMLDEMTLRVLDADADADAQAESEGEPGSDSGSEPESAGHGGELCGFRLDREAVGDGCGVTLGELYRTPRGWGFRAEAVSYPAGLLDIAQAHGVNV